MAEPRPSFSSSRLGSVLAFAPLGVWTVIHLWNNLYAVRGADAWERAVTMYPHVAAQVLTYVVVFLPLLLHAVWGLLRIARSRPNNLRYTYYANLKYLLQRVSALGVLLFLGAHVYLALIRPRLLLGHGEVFADISHEMRFHAPTTIVYLLGTLGVAYHLANGVQTFLMKLGMRWPRRIGDRLEWPFLLLFLILLAMSWATMVAMWLAAGGRA
jgi:succinate dehydrogenase / fumarate reductase, cytochrome b subunit